MFKQFRNIDTAFKHIKTFSIISNVCMILLCGFVIYKSHEAVQKILSSIWVIVDGRPIQAQAAASKDDPEVEGRQHVTNFHQLFFTLDPDDKAITANITKALYLADESAKREYDNLREKGYYSGLISGNISQRITVDSIRLDMRSEPYGFTCHATQRLIRASGTLTRSLTTTGTLRNVKRTDNNPHGFLIQRWETVENRDIQAR